MYRGFLFLCMAVLSLALASCTNYGNGGQPDGEDGGQLDGEDGSRDDGDVVDGDSGGSDAAGDTGGDIDIACAFGDEFMGQFDKSCSSDGQCVIVIFSADCCGTGQAEGLNASDRERFEKAWKYCLTQLPMCGCPSGPTKVEDGNSTWDHDSIRVRCSDNACSTYLP